MNIKYQSHENIFKLGFSGIIHPGFGHITTIINDKDRFHCHETIKLKEI